MKIEVEDIRRLVVNPGETLVIRMGLPRDPLTGDPLVDWLREQITEHLPEGVKVLVTDSDVEMAVVAGDARVAA